MQYEVPFTYMFTAVLIAVINSIIAIGLLMRFRHMIIKPTFFIGLTGLLGSWATVFDANLIYTFLINPWDYIIVIQITPLLILILSIFSFNRTNREVWELATKNAPYDYLALRPLVPITLIISAICVCMYFLYVPPWKTGLWVIFQYGDPAMSRVAREESSKLLPAIPRYANAINRATIAVFLAGVLAMTVIAKRRSYGKKLFIIPPLLLLLLAALASIHGGRSPGAFVLGAFIYSLFLYKKFPFKLSYFLMGLAVVLTIPTLITVARSGGTFTIGGLWQELSETIATRLFRVNTQVGMWHMDYVQRNGFWGFAGIPKIAPLFGIQPVIVDHVIINEYFKDTRAGLGTTACFMTNYERWGLFAGTVLSVALVWSLDLALPILRRLNPVMLIPAITVISIAVFGIYISNFETMLISRGYIPGLILFLILNRYLRARPMPSPYETYQARA